MPFQLINNRFNEKYLGKVKDNPNLTNHTIDQIIDDVILRSKASSAFDRIIIVVPTAKLVNRYRMQIIAKFTDANNQPCDLTINSVFSSGVGDRSDSITISDSDQTKKILLPKTMTVALTRNNAIIFSGKVTFEYDASSQTLSGNLVINMDNGYHLSIYLDLTNNQLTGAATATKSGKYLIDVTADMQGTNLIQHLIDNKLYLGIDETTLKINMQDGISLHLHTSANITTIKSLIARYKGYTTYTDAEKQEIADMCNKYIQRSILVHSQRAATLTFEPRATATDRYVFGQLDTKVTYVDGQTSKLNELFTAGERNTFVNDITSFIAGYNNLKKLLDLPTE